MNWTHLTSSLTNHSLLPSVWQWLTIQAAILFSDFWLQGSSMSSLSESSPGFGIGGSIWNSGEVLPSIKDIFKKINISQISLYNNCMYANKFWSIDYFWTRAFWTKLSFERKKTIVMRFENICLRSMVYYTYITYKNTYIIHTEIKHINKLFFLNISIKSPNNLNWFKPLIFFPEFLVYFGIQPCTNGSQSSYLKAQTFFKYFTSQNTSL